MQLTPEEVATLKALAVAAPRLEALLGAPASTQRSDSDGYEDTNAWLNRKIAEPAQRSGNHYDNLQARIENAWKTK